MPKLRVLTGEEAEKLKSRRGKPVDLTEYTNYLKELPVGTIGEASLEEWEKKPTVKRRITTAAKQLGKNVKYLRSDEKKLVFEIRETE